MKRGSHLFFILIYIGVAIGFGFWSISAFGDQFALIPLLSGIGLFACFLGLHLSLLLRQTSQRNNRQMLILTRAVQDQAKKINMLEAKNAMARAADHSKAANEGAKGLKAAKPARRQDPDNRPAFTGDDALDDLGGDDDYQEPLGRLSPYPQNNRPQHKAPQNQKAQDYKALARKKAMLDQPQNDDLYDDEDDDLPPRPVFDEEQDPPPDKPDVKILRNLVAQLYGRKDMRVPKDELYANHKARRQDRGQDIDDDDDADDKPAHATGLSVFKAAIGADQESALPKQAAKPLRSMDEDQFAAAVQEAIEAERVRLYTQPIVSLPDRNQVHTECFGRLIDAAGQEIVAERFVPTASRLGLMAELDQMVLFDHICRLPQQPQGQEMRPSYFCNLTHETFSDPGFFRQFLEQMETVPELLPNLTLEVSEADLSSGGPELYQALKSLRGVGFRLSLDRVSNPDTAYELVDRLGFHFVKIRAPALLVYLEENGGNSKIEDWEKIQCQIIADRIESESIFRELSEYEITLGQGFLFGAPQKISKTPYTGR